MLLTPKKMTIYLEDNVTIRQALERIDAHKFSVMPLVNEKGAYAGSLSEGDILRYIKNVVGFDIDKAEHVRINQIDHYRPYEALKINATFDDAFELSQRQNFIPVIDDTGNFIGIIKRKDIIKYLLDNKNK